MSSALSVICDSAEGLRNKVSTGASGSGEWL